jgi:chromosome segregation ATPase
MSAAILKFAKALRDRKGLGGGGRNDPPAPSAPSGGGIAGGTRVVRRIRSRFLGRHEIANLRAARDAARKRADKAERALTALEAKVMTMGKKYHEIQRLREGVRLKYRKRQLTAALKRIESLEKENRILRNQTKEESA